MFALYPTGLQLEALAFELCGTLVRKVEANSLVECDGRLRSGDLILYLNHECLWRVTSSQAKGRFHFELFTVICRNKTPLADDSVL